MTGVTGPQYQASAALVLILLAALLVGRTLPGPTYTAAPVMAAVPATPAAAAPAPIDEPPVVKSVRTIPIVSTPPPALAALPLPPQVDTHTLRERFAAAQQAQVQQVPEPPPRPTRVIEPEPEPNAKTFRERIKKPRVAHSDICRGKGKTYTNNGRSWRCKR